MYFKFDNCSPTDEHDYDADYHANYNVLDVYVVDADYCHDGYNADCVGAFLFEHATTCTIYFVANA